MTATGTPPGRVLVVWCPQWPMTGGDGGPGAGAFEQVVSAVEEFTPRFEVLRPGACAISVRGPGRYFGGEGALATKIITAVTRRGFGCQAGIANGLFTAQLAAQAASPGETVTVAAGRAREFLSPHPVWVLGSAELADLLPRLGIGTLGEFASLPATEAANRFGAQGAAAHRLACGLAPRPLVPRLPPASFAVSAGFDPPVPQAGPVIFAAKALAEQMHAGLAARGLACVRVRVQAVCEDGREITRLWRHDGLLSPLAVAERVRWQLAGWRDGQAGRDDQSGRGEGVQAGGITMLRLVPDQLVRDEGRQLALWGDAVVSDRVARAAVRVQAMLGHQAVTRPVMAGGRSPGEQVTLTPFGEAGEPARPAGRPWPGQIPPPAPATVYPSPLPARVTDDVGAAVIVTGRAMVSASPARLSAAGAPPAEIIAWAGPWPADERWWDPARASRRARFQLVTAEGSAWLAAVQDGRWLIEARYD
jgi:protein ImuB